VYLRIIVVDNFGTAVIGENFRAAAISMISAFPSAFHFTVRRMSNPSSAGAKLLQPTRGVKISRYPTRQCSVIDPNTKRDVFQASAGNVRASLSCLYLHLVPPFFFLLRPSPSIYPSIPSAVLPVKLFLPFTLLNNNRSPKVTRISSAVLPVKLFLPFTLLNNNRSPKVTRMQRSLQQPMLTL
jgi:hypothetical protein